MLFMFAVYSQNVFASATQGGSSTSGPALQLNPIQTVVHDPTQLDDVLSLEPEETRQTPLIGPAQREKVNEVPFKVSGKTFVANSIQDFSKVREDGWYHTNQAGTDYIFFYKKDNGDEGQYYFGKHLEVVNGKMTGVSPYKNPNDFIRKVKLGESSQEQAVLPGEDHTSCKLGFSGLISKEAIDRLEQSSSEAADRLLERDLLEDFEENQDECVTEVEADKTRDWAVVMDSSLKGEGNKIEDSAYSYGLKHFIQNFELETDSDGVVNAEELDELLRGGEKFSKKKYREAKAMQEKYEKSYKTGEDEIKKWMETRESEIEERIKELKDLHSEKVEPYLKEKYKNPENAEYINPEDSDAVAELKEVNTELEDLEGRVSYTEELKEKKLALEELKKKNEEYTNAPQEMLDRLQKKVERQRKAREIIKKIATQMENFFEGKSYSFKGLVSSKEELKKLITGDKAFKQINEAFVRGIRKKQSEAEFDMLDNDIDDHRIMSGVLYLCETKVNEDTDYSKKYNDADVINKKIRRRSEKDFEKELNKNGIENLAKVDGFDYLNNGHLLADKPGKGEASTAVVKSVNLPKSFIGEGGSPKTKYDIKIDDFGPEVRFSARESGSARTWTRLDRQGTAGKLSREGLLILHDPLQESSGRLYAFKGGKKYLLSRHELNAVESGNIKWSDLSHKRYLGSSRIDFTRRDKGGFEIAVPSSAKNRFEEPLLTSGLTSGQNPGSTNTPQTQTTEEAPTVTPEAEQQVAAVTQSGGETAQGSAPAVSNEVQEGNKTSISLTFYSKDDCKACIEKMRELIYVYKNNPNLFKQGRIKVTTKVFHAGNDVTYSRLWKALPWTVKEVKLQKNQESYVRTDGSRSNNFPSVDIDGKSQTSIDIASIVSEISAALKIDLKE